MKKIIIGVICVIILSGVAVVGTTKIKENKANDIPKEVIKDLEAKANEQVKTLVAQEVEKVKASYEEELKTYKPEPEDENSFKALNYYDLILKYYENAEKDKLIMEETVNDNGVVDYKLTFNKNNTSVFITDNENKKNHSYKIEHKKNSVKEKEELKTQNEVIINMTSKAKEKFDIKNATLIKDYIEQLLKRKLSDNELSVINVATNIDMKEVSSLEELEKYVSEEEGIKIDNLGIESKSTLDDVSGSYVTTFILKLNESVKIKK